MEWKTSKKPVDYPKAIEAMEQRVLEIANGAAPEMVWLLEHPPLYTAGTSAKTADLLDKKRFPIYSAGRGGQYTYHGPGQRIAYVMLDLKKRAEPKTPDLRGYVKKLEQWIIMTLAEFGVEGFTRDGRIGVWVHTPSRLATRGTLPPNGRGESKIAALGIRVRKGVSYHGISLNISPDLSHYSGIVPCGIGEFGVTSLEALGVDASMSEVDSALKRVFSKLF